MPNNSLVSVILVSYNSAKTIAETLDSIKKQTYDNYEIIVSDDNSSDNTIDVANAWINENKDIACKLVSSKINTGTSANCNRGLAVANGDWIKVIAADDILLPNCIEDNMNFVHQNPDAKIVQSLCELYVDDFSTQPTQVQPSPEKYIFFELENGLKQYHFIRYKGNYIYAPSIFINSKFLKEIGGYDERFKFIEDYPLWLKATKNNVKIHLLKKMTVGYRIHSKSVMKMGKPFMTEKFAKENIYFLEHFFEGDEKDFTVKKEIFKYKIVIKLERLGFNRPGFFSKILY